MIKQVKAFDPANPVSDTIQRFTARVGLSGAFGGTVGYGNAPDYGILKLVAREALAFNVGLEYERTTIKIGAFGYPTVRIVEAEGSDSFGYQWRQQIENLVTDANGDAFLEPLPSSITGDLGKVVGAFGGLGDAETFLLSVAKFGAALYSLKGNRYDGVDRFKYGDALDHKFPGFTKLGEVVDDVVGLGTALVEPIFVGKIRTIFRLIIRSMGGGIFDTLQLSLSGSWAGTFGLGARL